MQHGRLRGRRIAVLAADGFEKLELTVPVMALRLAGATVDIISLRPGRIRGVNLHEPAGRVHVDYTISEADPNRYDGLLVPGGFINPDLLRQSAQARAFVRWFDEGHNPSPRCVTVHGSWPLRTASRGAHSPRGPASVTTWSMPARHGWMRKSSATATW